MSTQKKRWLEEVDIMRAFGILAVLAIHSTGPTSLLWPKSFTYYFFISINYTLAFAVPMFLFISALVLAFKYSKEENINWIKFYKSRLTQIIIPYLVWTVIYLLYRTFVYNEHFSFLATPGLGDDAKFTIKTLLLGKGYFHLYFLSVIVQFYIVFPLIIMVFNYFIKMYNSLFKDQQKKELLRVRIMNFSLYFLMITACQFGFIVLNKYYIYPYFKYPGSILPSYIMPIGIGLWIGYNYDNWCKYVGIVRVITYPLAVIFGWLFVNVSINNWYLGQPDANIIAIIRNVYVTCASLIFFEISLYIANNWNGWLKKSLADLGACSFGIFLLHLLILKTMHRLNILGASGSNMIVYSTMICITFVVTLAGSWLAVKLINKTPAAPILFGNRRTVKK
ncbi:MAG: acyltransferase [Ignavibacteriales bacterium]